MNSSKPAPRPFTAREERMAKPVMRVLSAANTWVYRVSGGKFGARWMYGAPVCLLVTTGRKSGERRTVPLLYLEDGARIVLVGSQGGMSKDPLWVKNLDADGDCEIEIGKTNRKMRSRRADAAEKAKYWPALCKMYPDYADYQARTTRDIPVLLLDPR